jgi:hypothetical protein
MREAPATVKARPAGRSTATTTLGAIPYTWATPDATCGH